MTAAFQKTTERTKPKAGLFWIAEQVPLLG